MTIHYVTGDAAHPQGSGPRVIAHIVNDEGRWGSGFVLALSKRDPVPEEAYRYWALTGVYDDPDFGTHPFALGHTQFIAIGSHADLTFVANMIAQRGVRSSPSAPRAVRYGALINCLNQVARFCLMHHPAHPKASVHMPRIGCGLGGGTWEHVEPIINDTLIEQGIDVTVYDL